MIEPTRKELLERAQRFEAECKKMWDEDADRPRKREFDVLGMSDALMEQALLAEEDSNE